MIFSKIKSKIVSKIIKSIVFLFIINTSFAQITSGKITYERKTNLMKKFKNERSERWLNESNKIVIDVFDLYFNDTFSVFIPYEDPNVKNNMSWATNKNSVIQNNSKKTRLSILSVWGELAYVQDSLVERQWKITDNKRKIGKYQCTKAIFQLNDTTRFYAWFSEDIIPSIGPETFRGLPGAILGLATEDGGVVYFAKKVELLEPDFQKITPKMGKKVFSHKDLKTKLENDFGDKPWGKDMVQELFMW
jgi:GLPGLI family protein